MKRIVTSLLALAVLAPAFAQNASSSSSSAFPPGLPPPGMNDPGVDAKTVAPAPKPVLRTTQAAPAAASTSNPMTRPIPALPTMHDTRDSTMPTVSVRQDGDDSIQEYRQNGRLYMVIVTPKGGIPQTYMVDDRGRLTDSNGAPPIRPVMYKVLEWGKSKPAESSDDQDAGSDGH